MKYIAIFEDRKGFTKVLEFAQLPHRYLFAEQDPRPYGILCTREGELPNPPLATEIVFLPKGKLEEVYGQKIQKYYQQ